MPLLCLHVVFFSSTQAVRPCATVVELCKSRSAVMWSDGPLSTASTSGRTVGGEGGGSEGPSDGEASSDGERTPAGGVSSRLPPALRPASNTNVMSLSGGGGAPWGERGGGGFFSTMQRSVQLGGQSALLLRVLLSNLAGAAAGGPGPRMGMGLHQWETSVRMIATLPSCATSLPSHPFPTPPPHT